MAKRPRRNLNVLKRWRIIAEATQEELSQVSTYTDSQGELHKVDAATISLIENLRHVPRYTTLNALVKGLNVLFEQKQIKPRPDSPVYHVVLEDLAELAGDDDADDNEKQPARATRRRSSTATSKKAQDSDPPESVPTTTSRRGGRRRKEAQAENVTHDQPTLFSDTTDSEA